MTLIMRQVWLQLNWHRDCDRDTSVEIFSDCNGPNARSIAWYILFDHSLQK